MAYVYIEYNFLPIYFLYRYVDLILSLLMPKGAILMHTYEYNQEERPTVPYSISGQLLQDLWGKQALVLYSRVIAWPIVYTMLKYIYIIEIYITLHCMHGGYIYTHVVRTCSLIKPA